jgi:hypothetical protein
VRRPALLFLAVAAGLLALRLVDAGWRLAAPFPVTVAFAEGGDDAYYYFTVARNLARGLGLTIDGVHWTSGFQPLWGLLGGAFFLLPGERLAFAAVYLASLACWIGSAALFLRFVRRASRTPVDSFTATALVALFLAERQLSSLYVNGMETGLHCLLVLALLVAFEDLLQHGSDAGAAARLGLLTGLAMLARNDVAFLAGFLLVPLMLQRRWRDVATIVGIGSVLLLPWLAYCQWVVGSPLPQSGIATSDAVRHVSAPAVTQYAFAVATIPILFFKMAGVMWAHPLPSALAGGTLMLVAAFLVLGPRSRAVTPTSRSCLLALAGFSAVLMIYYPAFSAAFQFYERYFASAKLLLLILLALLFVRARQRLQGSAVFGCATIAAVLLAFATNLVQVGSGIGAPWLSHMGAPALETLKSPLANDGSRIGMMESGRLGYLFPDRVVNLDGKMNVAALAALRAGRMVDYLAAGKFDHLMLYGYDVAYFDRVFPGWRDLYAPDDRFTSIQLFTRKPSRP